MNLSQKYNNLEATINQELSQSAPDFEKLFYCRSTQNAILKNGNFLNRIGEQLEPQNVYYLQCSDIEKSEGSLYAVRFIRVKSNQNPFSDIENVYWCKFGANGQYSTVSEKIIIWGGVYLKIQFTDIEQKTNYEPLKRSLKVG